MNLSNKTVHLLFLAFVFGPPLGIGAYVFIYAQGDSYFTNNPVACTNCHIMRPQYESWSRSSHKNVAVCNDCHTPGNMVEKYQAKALNGWHHSRAFTTGNFHEPIKIKPANLALVENACRSCHQDFIEKTHIQTYQGTETSCTRCHREVGHSL